MEYLSHFLDKNTPTYGNNPDDISIQRASCICNGDSANSMKISFKNHVGTHIDLPNHFDDSGKVLSDFPPETWFFSNPQVLNLKCPPDYLITKDDLNKQIKPNTDFLIIKTGFESKRNQKEYWNNNPGIDQGIGTWLRSNFPSLRAVGFDFISLSSYQHREIGRISHKEFLSKKFNGRPILIVEDMKLANLNKTPDKVIISPLLVKNADGVPVTVISY